jgi:hypothetical protein
MSTETIPYPLGSDTSGVVLYTDLSNVPQSGNAYTLRLNGTQVSSPCTYITDYPIDMGFLVMDASYFAYYSVFSSQITENNEPIIVNSGPNLVFNGAITTDASGNIYAICEFVYNVTITVLDYFDIDTGTSYYSQVTGDTGSSGQFPRQLALVKVDPFYGTLQYLLDVTLQTDYNGVNSFFLDPTRTYLYYLVDGGMTQQKTYIKKIALSDGTQTDVYHNTTDTRTPFGMTMDSFGNLYVAENYGDVLKVDPSTGTATVYATFRYESSQQPADPTDIRYGKPQAITCDSMNNIYVTDNGTSINGVSLKCMFKIPYTNVDGTNYQPATTAGIYDAIPGLIDTSIFDTFFIQADDLNYLYAESNGRVYKVDLASPSLSVYYENFRLKARSPNNNILCSSTASPNIQRIAATTYTFVNAYISDYSGQNYVDLSLNDGTADVAGIAVRVYSQLPSSDSTLSAFTIEGTDVLTPGSSITVPYYTTSVSVSVTPTDAGATYNISGDTGYSQGNIYTVTVVVTAQDGVAQSTYTADVYVDTIPFVPSGDSSLSAFTINGNDMLGSGSISVPYYTTSVSVSVTPTDAGATYNISGDTGYSQGNIYTVTVVVTAQDGVTQSTYTADVYVDSEPPPSFSSDNTLSVFTIEGTDVLGGGSITVPYGTTSVSVNAVPFHPGASITSISGDTGLTAGANTVNVTVTAEDGTPGTYSATVIVSWPSNVSDLATFTINGYDVLTPGTTINLPSGTTTVSVVATPQDANATAVVSGDTGLHVGDNVISVTSTAQDGLSVSGYSATVYISASSDSTLATFTINGIDVLSPGSTVNVSYDVSSVTVQVTTNNANALYTISGDTGLHTGSNTVSVVVVAEDGTTTQTYTATVQVANIVCFREGAQILCLVEGREAYIPIQSMCKGVLVKTHLHGYVPVETIGYSKLYNPPDRLRAKNRLYKLKPALYPELMEPLYLTGCHSVLVNGLSDAEKEDTIGLLGRVFITDDKYRLMACIDERATPYSREGIYTIWHFALEHVDYYKNYGVYANGLLVESCSRRMMQEYSGMKLI